MSVRVLLVDDNEDLRFLLRRSLEAHPQFEVVGEAGDGRRAVALAELLRPDIVLLDLAMPEMTGLEALPRIRTASPSSEVVILSSFPHERMADKVTAAGAVGYLEKGITAQRLLDELLIVGGVLETVSGAIAEAVNRFRPEPQSARSARKFVDETLRRWDCADELDVVTLLVSELVTNAVVHAGTDIDVGVRLLPAAIRIEVDDASGALPELRDAAESAESGRGMDLVHRMAQSWGVEQRAGGGKVVWFDVPRLDRLTG